MRRILVPLLRDWLFVGPTLTLVTEEEAPPARPIVSQRADPHVLLHSDG